MKIRHGVIISITLFIGMTILASINIYLPIQLSTILFQILSILWIASIGLIIYLIIRNKAAKKAITKTQQNEDYRSEAQRAYENVTPKRKRDEKPPWEE